MRSWRRSAHKDPTAIWKTPWEPSVGKSARLPELGRRAYAAGPQGAARELAAYLRREATRSDLSLADPDMAARHFLELVKGDLHARALFNAGQPSKAEINTCVCEGVRTFPHGSRSIWRT